MSAVQFVPYDPAWPKKFEEERQALLALPGLCARAVEHIGSTAVPGQIAKPIIDVFVALDPLEPLSHYEKVFPRPPYRFTFTDMDGRYLFSKWQGGTWTHNIHLLPWAGFYERKEFLFRDYLRSHPESVQEFNQVKRSCAAQFPGDLECYSRAKTAFIQRIHSLICAQKQEDLK